MHQECGGCVGGGGVEELELDGGDLEGEEEGDFFCVS